MSNNNPRSGRVELNSRSHSYNFPLEVWNAIPHAGRRQINDERQQYCAMKRTKVSEVTYVPQAINVQQDDIRPVPGSTAGSTTPSRAILEQSNDFNCSIMGGSNEQAQIGARNPANMK